MEVDSSKQNTSHREPTNFNLLYVQARGSLVPDSAKDASTNRLLPHTFLLH